MKRLMAIAALAFGPLACVANQGDAPIRFLQARALEFEEGVGCTGSEDFFIIDGSLDVSGKENFLMNLSVETNTFRQPITINQEIFSDQGPGDINLTELIYSYEAEAEIDLPPDEEDRVAIYAVFRPETDAEESSLFIRAFGPKALVAVHALPVDAPPVTVLVTVKARGKFSGGQTVESNKFIFPVTVFNSGFNPNATSAAGLCPGGKTPRLTGTCGYIGQDARICPALPPP